MNKSFYNLYKSSLLLGKNVSLLGKKLTRKDIDRAKKEVEVELRNKNFKNKNF
mgnify:FL=1|jgi:hypothetical protein|tara:strand:+ start:172 stop:330 length:159 start_codon:yes stop_codon:yes gene_type:complete